MGSEDTVGKRIRDCRESQKISQAQLAKQLGLTSAAIWNWETQGRVPRPKTLSKVAEILYISEEYLAEGRAPRHLPTPAKSSKTNSVAAIDSAATESVAVEIGKLRTKIAKLTGFELSQIRLELTVVD